MTGVITIKKAAGKDEGFELEDNSSVRELRVEAADFLLGSQSGAMLSLHHALMKAKTGDWFILLVELED